eukprot:Skav212339  [mRNA]  locus=scaffold1488:121363:127226:+ [translate_table: standard]
MNQEKYFGVRLPGKVIGACVALALTAYVWLGCGFGGVFNKKDGYVPMENASQQGKDTTVTAAYQPAWYFWLSAFLNWIAMPLLMLYFAKDATCTGGPPNSGYAVYAFFLVAHIILMALAVQQTKLPVSFCSCSKDIFRVGPVMVFFLILDHLDGATDALFVGSAVACTDLISSTYQSSWEAIPGAGPQLTFTIQEMGFSGIVLFVFFNFVYVPQLTGQKPFFALVTTMICGLIMLFTLHWGWLVGIFIFAAVVVIFAWGGLFGRQWRIWKELSVGDEISTALFCGMNIFEQALNEREANERLVQVTLTRLVFENLLQLWIQTSFFSLTFNFTDWDARLKNAAGMIIGLAVGASKVPALITQLRTSSSWVNLSNGFNWGTFIAWVLLFVVIIYALVLVWISARLVGAFSCESHMWGLTTGCLPP